MRINTGVSLFYTMIIKTFAALAAVSMLGVAAHAEPQGIGNKLEDGFYVYTEVESDWTEMSMMVHLSILVLVMKENLVRALKFILN